MGADYDHLRAFILASTKLQLSSRHAVSLLRGQVDALEKRLDIVSPLATQAETELEAVRREKMDEIFAILEERTDALLSALEVYANG